MDQATQKRVSPSAKWYALPILLFFVGPLISLSLIISLILATKHSVTFYIPGTAQIFITKPGEYTLWIENQSQNKAERVKTDLPTMALTFIDPKTNQALSMRPKIGWNDHKGPISHFSLGSVKFKQTGTYLVAANGRSMVPYKVYLRTPSLPTILKTILFSILLTLLSTILSVLFAIIILVRRMNARRYMEPSKQPPLEEKEKSQTGIPHQDITWAMVCHLSGFCGFIFPLANVIAPLLIWGFKRHDSAYMDEQGKQAINFQISITIYYIVAAILILVLVGFILLPLLAAFHIIAMIMAAIETAHGKHFHYPLSIQFLR